MAILAFVLMPLEPGPAKRHGMVRTHTLRKSGIPAAVMHSQFVIRIWPFTCGSESLSFSASISRMRLKSLKE